jgi:hypothetical protein
MEMLIIAIIYLVAMAIPAWLLYRFGSGAWYWHVLAILGGLAVGLTPLPPLLTQLVYNLMVGFVFLFLMVWGIGGLFMMLRPRHAKRAKPA